MSADCPFEIKELGDSRSDRDRVERLLWALDSDYVPPLSTCLSIEKYAEKLVSEASIFILEMRASDVGLVAMYANDFKARRAYISTIGVSRHARGIGAASSLLDAAIHYARSVGMLCVRLEVSLSNKSAMKLYRKKGFERLETDQPLTYKNAVIMEKMMKPCS